ncbi:MAG: thioredoxin domain-containing protein [Gemmatimonas sp.]|nr:thioredoxin domain-containing protein [Gemmatimonas sp.]
MRTMFRIGTLFGVLLVLSGGCDRGGESQEPPASDAKTVGPDIGHATGLESAPVTVVEFSDFGCPYCAQFALNTYPQIHTEFVLGGHVRWIYVPFVIGRFPNGDAAALAGECAGEQSRFWPMHDLLFQHQSQWRRAGPADDVFYQFADSVGLDASRFDECYRENHPGARIERHNELARRAGVRGTPSFLVNGRQIEGALPPDQFRALLEWAVTAAP